MSLTDEQIWKKWEFPSDLSWKQATINLCREVESAATAPLLERIAELERELEAVRNEVLEEAAKRCAAEKVNYELTQHAADEAYNMAVDHCAAAIRALKQ
jgi:hypothetical protein